MSGSDGLLTAAPPADGAEGAFPALSALRAAHGELLRRHREQGESAALLAEMAHFIRRGRATGALLDHDDERWVAQGMLDYWSTLLYRHGFDALDATLADFDPSLAPELPDDACPYRGLDAFLEGNREVFFGRQRLVKEMVERLQNHRLLAVVGPSGSGKSSAVRAGLLPALRAGALPTSETWLVYPTLVPGSTPLANLARLFLPPDADPVTEVAQQVAALLRDPAHLLHLLGQRTEAPGVLVVDQFEELFTLCEDEAHRLAFADALAHVAEAPDGNHRVILTMRLDFVPYVPRLPRLHPLFDAGQLYVPPLSASELREAIEGPAARVGLRFEQGVVEALVNDILGEPAALPLLQFTLLKLWEQRERNRVTWAAYRRLGGARQALAHSADAFYDSLIFEDQEAVRHILLRMVRPGEGSEVTSNRIPRVALFGAGIARDRLERVLDRLTHEQRLVRLTEGQTREDDQIEVAHEALIRNWPRLVSWLDDERERLRHRLRLTAAAEQWQALRHDADALWGAKQLEEVRHYRDLNELEAAFVAASEAAIAAAEQAREAARQRELAQAQALAEAQRIRAEQQARFARLLRWLVAALCVMVLVALGAAITAGAQRQAAVASAEEAQSQRALAVAEANRAATAEAIAVSTANELQSLSLAEDAQDALDLGDGELALTLALSATASLNPPPAPGAQRVLAAAAYAPGTRRLFTHGASVLGVAISPDGRRALSAGADGALALWELEGGQERGRLRGHSGRVWGVTFDPSEPSGQRALSASADGTLILWDVASGEPLRRFAGHEGAVLSVAVSLDGQRALSGGADGTVILWDVASGEPLRRIEAHQNWVWAVAFSPDAAFALSGSEDRSVRLWDTETGEEIARFDGHSDGVRTVAYSPDGSTVVSGSYDDEAILWDVASGGPLPTLAGGRGTVYQVAYSPDGRHLAAANEDGSVLVWETSGQREPLRLAGHRDWARAVQFTPDGRQLLSGSDDGTLRLWDLQPGAELAPLVESGRPRFAGHSALVTGMAFHPDGATPRVLSGDTTGNLVLWDVQREEELGRFATDGGEAVQAVAFDEDGSTALASSPSYLYLWDVESGARTSFLNPYGNTLAVGFGAQGPRALSQPASRLPEEELLLWEVASSAPVRRLDLDGGTAYSGAIRHDGEAILVGLDGGALLLWEDNEAEPRRLQGNDLEPVYAVAFSPDGRQALAASKGGMLRLWDLQRGAPIRQFSESNAATVRSLAFGPEGTGALSSGEGGLFLWDVAAGQVQRRIGAGTAVNDVALDPAGQRALAARGNGALLLWDVADGALRRRLREGGVAINSVALSPAGGLAATGAEDGVVTLWDVAHGTRSQEFRHAASAVNSVAFSQDGSRLLSGGSDATVVLWDVANGRRLGRFSEHSAPVWSVAFSPNGLTALWGAADGALILWDVATAEPLRRLEGHSAGVRGVAFAPDGRTALSASEDRALILWELGSGALLRRFEGHSDTVRDVLFAPDGLTALSASLDGTVRLWDVATGAELQRFAAGVPLYNLIFQPDEGIVVAGDGNGALRRWRLRSLAALREWAQANRYLRPLTCDERQQYRVRPPCDPAAVATATPLAPTPTPLPVEAGELEVGETRGEVPPGGSQRWGYEGRAGELLSLLVRADRPANGASVRERQERALLDTVLVVYGPDGELLAEANDLLPDVQSDSALSGVLLPTAGRYPIEIRSRDDAVGGAYTLSVAPVARIELGQVVTSTIEQGEQERWAFEGRAGQLVTVRMNKTGSSDLDSYLTLLNAEGEILASNDDDGGERNALISRYPLPETATYLIEARGYDLASEGAYTLLVSEPVPEAEAAREEGLALARQGQVEEALETLRRAATLDPLLDVNPESEVAAILLEVGRGQAGEGNIEQALATLRRAAELDPTQPVVPEEEVLLVLVDRATAQQEEGDFAQALATLRQAASLSVNLDPTLLMTAFNELCWAGAIAGQATLVLPACDEAVARAPGDGGIRDSRGVARALGGEFAGAIEDFEAFIQWAEETDQYAELIPQRQAWIEQLRAGQNPFDEATLDAIRDQ